MSQAFHLQGAQSCFKASEPGGMAVREGSLEEAKSEQNVLGWVGTSQEKGRGYRRGRGQAVTLGRAKGLSDGRGLRSPAVHTGLQG